MRVLHLAAECAPIAKVGGLGDVIGALPKVLPNEGVEAAVVMPSYGSRSERPLAGHDALRPEPPRRVHAGSFSLGGRKLPYEILRTDALGFPLYLVNEPEHFGGPGVYVDARTNTPFENAATRWFAFQLAALDWLAGQADEPASDVLHAHDHHAGLVPVLVKEGRAYRALQKTPVAFTVHSAEHQGVYPWKAWASLGVYVEPAEALLVEDDLNSMKAALHWADRVTTVSPSYADELTSDAAIAHGLLEAFRAARPKLSGILNGIDPSVWHPRRDPFLPAPYDADDLGGKAEVKRAVCAELGLDATKPLLCFVGRLMEEKGAEILPVGIERILAEHDASVAVLGTGKPQFEAVMQSLAERTPAGRLALRLAFDEALAHRLYAGADVFLMPSKVEPCGLGQLYALTYGTPPVVHATGGLRDTVRDWDGAMHPPASSPARGSAARGNGFAFEAFSAEAFAAAAARALAVYADREEWTRLQRNAMLDDWSWSRSAPSYAELYRAMSGG